MNGVGEVLVRHEVARRGRQRLAAVLGVLIVLGYAAMLLATALRQKRLDDELVASVFRCDAKAVARLLSSGANPNARWEQASKPGVLQTILRLIRRTTHREKDDRPTALEVLVAPAGNVTRSDRPKEDLQLLHELLAAGANPNAYHLELSPLYCAIITVHPRTAQALLAAGADPNIGTADLVGLFSGIDADTLRLMIHHGLNVNSRRADGMTPLLAVCKTPALTAGLLLAAGADVNAIDLDGRTPLTAAISRGDTQEVRLLLRFGAKPNLVGIDNPLHLAVRAGSLDIVKSLILAGADTRARGIDGKTPLSEAQSLGRQDLVAFILKHGGGQ